METERLVLRPYEEDDFDFYVSLWRDPEMVKYIGIGRTRNRDECRERFHQLRKIHQTKGGTGLLVAMDKQSGEYIGHAGLIPQIIDRKVEMEIGYWMTKSHWGKGYASELALYLRDYGFDTLSEKRLVSIIKFDNKASIAVAKKTGLTFEREVHFGLIDCALYSMVR
ncbi:GNAT family N-acetyltransferase [Priestia taiwanensis]|uniref:Acetyltransferase n=1 Tax=Priestia taiwanensis TaxID=1347902 RepID=A0A917EK67_9BACI|nr:GNAT family N-acetyltransferase [Priestia taiwanensis]MBM7361441.1 RimJ/RimL family protein N-acetyltransferase [Priestia taiwanensis]GGE54173.1 acetyltransferase [Priestia taiwanensis]